MLGKITEFLVLGFVPLVIGMLAVPEPAASAEKTLKGEAIYRERIALPPNAVLSVQLADVSRADAPAQILGQQIVDPAGQVPIAFEISFDPSTIKPNMTYVLQARITVDGRLMFITDQHHRVDPLSDKPQTVMLRSVAGQAASPDAIYGQRWVAEFIDGVETLPTRPVTFQIEQTGRVFGKGPCNSYFAAAKVDGTSLLIGQAGSTQMACSDELMQAERAMFNALDNAASFKVEAGKLIILDKDGHELMRFVSAA